MAPDPLSLAVAAIRQWLAAFTAAAWEKSPGVTDKDMQTFAARMAPTVAASQMKVANLVTTKVARDHGLRPVPVDEELITLARGIDPVQVYQRPIIAARTALSTGKTFDEARNLGALRARQLCLTDVQMAKVRQYDRSLTEADQKFFRRVPQGPATCALCLIAATQPYTVGKLMPIHPGCDCGIEEIPAGMDLDHLLDTRRLLEATHAQVKEFTAIEDRGGRAVDYRKLLITKDHGEIGPLLAWNGQAFTGPKDIPGPAAGHSAKPQVTKIADETPADRARKLLPGLEKSLADLRAKGLSEESSQVTYHKQQIEKHTAALADEGTRVNPPAASRRDVSTSKTGPKATSSSIVPPVEPPAGGKAAGPDENPEDRMNALFADQTNSVTPRQKASVERWQGTDRFYEQVQNAFEDPDNASDEALQVMSDMQDIAAPLPEEVVLWRGIRDVTKELGAPAADLQPQVKELNRFMATTLHRQVAASEFTRPGKNPALVKITARTGSRVVWVPPLGDPTMAGQGELTFTRGHQVAILRVDTSGDIPVIEVEVSPL
ncbi:hypothetical protein [Mycolicibacterium llatzerense]|uniref:hypothetical protein n=1 Tax=Mycolicibacterium llatzerense TaxID=280871 RepID=UPI0021B59E50|nr:hypothetical protein [Mycolicibacterium llatzerense]MCT7369454.1 hypothetical protein [Mycolicibacterium llatzerense]